ncbi:hypothetical protein [Azospirillum thermophilum]|uniref:DUF3035 domain-containing protein n=1 Tax=Azospirillum thermophilum TaxID=2202148 RepID=A0A2S2CTY8_9PROT|nr:hypothetical protein [Azospirillum thermophilum]AWK87939.1 hypothetical protein DEW08_09205 [Azospirillum thermophilum]
MSEPLPLPAVLAAALSASLLAACAADIRDDWPGRAQTPGQVAPNRTAPGPVASRPITTQTYVPGTVSGGGRLWSEQVQAESRAGTGGGIGVQPAPRPETTRRPAGAQDRAQDAPQGPQPQGPPARRRGSSSPPPERTVLPPQPVPLPAPPSTQDATDAFKRDLIRPEIDRMRTDDAMGKLDPLGQRDLMRRENDLRQWGGNR